MSLIGNIEYLSSTTDYDSYIERMEHLFACNEVPEHQKVSLFCTLIGGDAYKLLRDRTAVNYEQSSPAHVGKKICQRCGRLHSEFKCPAKSWKCFGCGKYGHTSKMCRSKVQEVKAYASSGGSVESEENFAVGHIISINKINQPLFVTVNIEGIEIQMEIDSGAGVSIMSDKLFCIKFPHISVEKCFTKLTSISGGNLEVIGKANVNVKIFNGQNIILPVYVIKSKCMTALLGRSWLDALNSNWRSILLNNDHYNKINILNEHGQDDSEIKFDKANLFLNKLKLDFPRVFNTDRCQFIKGFCVNIPLKENVIPVFHKPYVIPYALKPLVEEELGEMVKSGIIVPVRHSEWASPIVVVPRKPNSRKIRICVDFKVTLNPHIKTDHYPLPRVEDVIGTVANAKYFSKIDLSSAYLQLPVSEDSQKLLTISTHLGLYQYTRLPFGVTCAPAQFQSVMDQIIKDIPMTACYLDDIIVGGKTVLDCERNLRILFFRLDSHNVKVSVDKCQFFVQKIEFLGHELSHDGIRPMKAKVEAIQNAPSPTNISQLRSYLGLLNYYNKFLPMVSTVLQPLYDLEKKHMEFVWSSECQSAFDQSKSLLLNCGALAHYSPDKPIIISADASPYGVGCVMSHIIDGQERPVLFMSGTLSPAERNYAQLEREALAIIFAVRKFHRYIYGRKFILYTDHKPLEAIFSPKKGIPSLAAARLQRWAIILAAYDYDLVYRKGTDMSNADAMSRLPINIPTNEYIYSINENVAPPINALDVVSNMKQDKTLMKVVEFTKSGWPSKVEEFNLKPYFSKRQELLLDKDCLFWGNRLIIPFQLRRHVLGILHDQHVGIVRMKLLARGEVWWPGVDADIEEFANSCQECQQFLPRQKKIIVPWPETSRSWQRLHIDFLQKAGKYFLIIVDSFSRWIDVHIVSSTESEETFAKLRTTFSVFGIPEEVVSDNGPPFNGEKYKRFCLNNGIKCTFTPPLHPNSNGTAEKFVDVVKRNLSKQLFKNTMTGKFGLSHCLDNFLLKYRTTPCTVTGVSPAQVMLKQVPRTKLQMLKPTEVVNVQEKKENIRKNFIKKRFFEGQKVWILNKRAQRPEWIMAKVSERISYATYRVNVDGEIRFVHIDDMKGYKNYIRAADNPISSSDSQSSALGPHVIKTEINLEPNTSHPADGGNDIVETSSVCIEETPLDPPCVRRSQRISRKPDRFVF